MIPRTKRTVGDIWNAIGKWLWAKPRYVFIPILFVALYVVVIPLIMLHDWTVPFIRANPWPFLVAGLVLPAAVFVWKVDSPHLSPDKPWLWLLIATFLTSGMMMVHLGVSGLWSAAGANAWMLVPGGIGVCILWLSLSRITKKKMESFSR
jgi:hypothetical protein